MAKATARNKSSTQKETRFSIRAAAAQKRVIAQAALIKETTMSEFVLEQSLVAAQQVLADQAHFTLPNKQWEKFCAAQCLISQSS